MQLFDNTQLNHHTMVEGGVLANECAQVLKDFFKERRTKA
jgi:tRNA(adenine34) deaminase